MKLSKRQLKRIIREEKQKLQEAGDIYPRPQHPMVAQANADAASKRDLEQAIVSAFLEYCDGATGTEPFQEFEAAVARRLGMDVGELYLLCDKHLG